MPATYGICEDCISNFQAQEGIPLREYIENISAPVLLIDGEGKVVTANSAAEVLLGKPLPEIEGFMGGAVFECAHARLPEGCGKTVHCSGCTIRRTIMHTYTTGQDQRHVPAYLNREDLHRTEPVGLSISTVRIPEAVLLMVNEYRDRG